MSHIATTRWWALALGLLLGLLAPPAQAQSRDSLLALYNAQTIHALGSKYVKGSRQLSFGQLKTEFQPGLGQDLYRQSSQRRAFAQVLTVAAVGALVGSAFLRKNEQTGGVALLVVGIGLNLGNLSLRKKSNELVSRALWQRNKDVLFGPQP